MEYPGHRPFYKYASPETVLAVLKNRTVRYSSPLEFNDPFDQQVGLHFDFDPINFPDKLIDRYEFLARNPQIDLADPIDSVARLISFMREKYPLHGFPRQMVDLHIKPILASALDVMVQTRADFEKHWLDSLRATRAFCVSEEKDNLLMWAHYAKDHKGAVLELWSLPEEDNPLSVARRVEYTKDPPAFFTQNEFLDDFCGIKRLDLRELTRRAIHTKSDHWSYENEWRVYFPLSEIPGLYEDLNLRPSELKAIYFGCRAEDEFIEMAKVFLAQNYPATQQFKASKSTGKFAVQFSEI